jgi:uncharacterized damage-inducible protein DinB
MSAAVAAAAAASAAPAGAFAAHLRLLARYHRWAWARLFASLAALPPAPSPHSYAADVGLYAASVAGTVNHLLCGDLLWYSRFTGAPAVAGYTIADLTPLWRDGTPATAWAAVVPDRAAAEAAVRAQCDRWVAFTSTVTEEAAGGTLRYATTSGAPGVKPYGAALAHVFNHGTHHRGQITAAVTQAGLPAPALDLSYMLDEEAQAAEKEGGEEEVGRR